MLIFKIVVTNYLPNNQFHCKKTILRCYSSS